MKYEIGQLSVGQILDHSFRLFLDKWKLFFGIGMLVYAPLLLFQTVMTMALAYQPEEGASPEEILAATMESAVPVLIITVIFVVAYFILAGPLLSAAVTYAVSKEYLGEETSIRESLGKAFSKLIPVLWTGLISSIAILLGFLLFIIPGIFLMFRYYLAQPIVVLEHQSGFAAMRRSGELMKGSYGIAFVLSFVLWIAIMLGTSLFAIFPVPYVSEILTILAQTALTTIWIIASVVLYFHCRSRVENYDLHLLAESVGVDEPMGGPVPPPLPTAQ